MKRFDDPESEMCSGGSAKRKYIFILHSYLEIPMGLGAKAAEKYLDASTGNSDWVAENFVKILLTKYLTQVPPIGTVGHAEKLGGDTVSENSNLWFVNTGLDEFTHKLFAANDRSQLSLAWQSDFTFYLWNSARFGLVPSLNWAKSIAFDRSHDSGTCNEFLQYYGGRYGGTGCDNYLPPTGLLAFAGAAGFSAAEFVDSHYFSVSDSEKEQLCKLAGLQSDCFDFSSDNKIAEMRDSFENSKEARNKFAFLSHSRFTAVSFDKLRSDKSIVLDWQSALIKDLVLMSSIKISKKISGNFTDYRIDWDPSLFCKYGRPKSELYTH